MKLLATLIWIATVSTANAAPYSCAVRLTTKEVCAKENFNGTQLNDVSCQSDFLPGRFTSESKSAVFDVAESSRTSRQTLTLNGKSYSIAVNVNTDTDATRLLVDRSALLIAAERDVMSVEIYDDSVTTRVAPLAVAISHGQPNTPSTYIMARGMIVLESNGVDLSAAYGSKTIHSRARLLQYAVECAAK